MAGPTLLRQLTLSQLLPDANCCFRGVQLQRLRLGSSHGKCNVIAYAPCSLGVSVGAVVHVGCREEDAGLPVL